MMTTTAERLLAQGRAEGEARGLVEGESRGRAEVLTMVLTLKFGAPSVEMQARIQNASVADLDLWTARALGAESLAVVFVGCDLHCVGDVEVPRAHVPTMSDLMNQGRKLGGREDARKTVLEVFDAITEEFLAKGRAQGEARGRAEGEARGRAASLTKLFTLRAGALPAGLEARIQRASVSELDGWTELWLSATLLDGVGR